MYGSSFKHANVALLVWKNKAELLESKVKELDAHNDELRQQLEHLSAQGGTLIKSFTKYYLCAKPSEPSVIVQAQLL